MYKEWADGQVNKIKNILNAAREDHTAAVKTRIENVQQMTSVVDITKTLFEISKVCYSTKFVIESSNLGIGNRSIRGQGLRARTIYSPCCRGKGCS